MGIGAAATKCVLVIDGDLPVGLQVNTAAVLSVSVGKLVAGLTGADLKDASGQAHAGITTVPIPALRSDATGIAALRTRATLVEGVTVVDVTDVAQTSKTYDEYADRLGATPAEQLTYLGVALHGERRAVTRLTGSLHPHAVQAISEYTHVNLFGVRSYGYWVAG